MRRYYTYIETQSFQTINEDPDAWIVDAHEFERVKMLAPLNKFLKRKPFNQTVYCSANANSTQETLNAYMTAKAYTYIKGAHRSAIAGAQANLIDVRPVRIRDLTENDCRRNVWLTRNNEGFVNYWSESNEDLPLQSARESIHSYIATRPRQSDAWQKNIWVWVFRFSIEASETQQK